MEITVLNEKRVVIVDAEVAVLNFNYVAGAVYKDRYGEYNIPHDTSAKSYVSDCWQISAEEWDAGTRPIDLQNKGEVPAPVRAEDLGEFVGWLDEMPVNKKTKKIGAR